MKVLVVGVDKTGTSSAKHILERIYSLPCLHLYDLASLRQKIHIDRWVALFEIQDRQKRLIELAALLDNYQLASGFPVTAFTEDLIELYPEAKIILTKRDAEAWLAAFRSTTTPRIPEHSQPTILSHTVEGLIGFNSLRDLYTLCLRKIFGHSIDLKDDTKVLRAYVNWNAHVEQIVPAHRLFVYSIRQGWAPICRFLNYPVPIKTFPLVRRRTSLTKWDKAKWNSIQHWVVSLCAYALFALIAFYWASS